MSQRILITGGAGYLGSVLSEILLDAGHRVTVVDRLYHGQAPLYHLCENARLDFVPGDVRDEALMRKLVSAADVIIPLAAVVGAPACDRDPWLTEAINLQAIRFLNQIRSPDQLVVYPNTNSGYGTRSGASFCTEDTPLEPISLYGRTKCQAELDLLASPNTITLRLATVFGTSPRMRLDLLVNHFVYVAVTDGYIIIFEKDFKRNFIHIRDVADCFLHCISNASKMCGRPYNVGLDAANVSKEGLVKLVQKHVPKFVVHYSEIGVDPDKRDYIVSNQRLREAGFEARRSLDDGIQELIKGYRMLGRSMLKNV